MDQVYMKKAIALAKRGVGRTNPNPMVGAVIVKEGQIIAEGYHAYYGGPHAEVNAFKNATASVVGATMYVTLEPCSHYGKTPPCANLIVEKGIGKVVVGMMDPNPEVSGRGIALLKENNIEVVVLDMGDELLKLNEIFLKYIKSKKPFCILKTAMTIDGKIATKTGESKWITNEASRKQVHQLRHQVMGIMVGVGTVIADDPSLTTRLEDGRDGIDPIRIILDTRGRIPLDAKVLTQVSEAITIVATTDLMPEVTKKAIEATGNQVMVLPIKEHQVDMIALIEVLGEQGIDSILIEGGATLNYSALQAGVVDKVIAYVAPKIFGGDLAKTPVGGIGISKVKEAILLEDLTTTICEGDIVIEGYIKKEGL
ncbi:bifunctional diaminohydroxyphosphoribosylaminopyrimidine deaminase/5-amino-6-(5-phosphoribosylamino)uracil reductase RibD [Petrocella sp. FN5]|uniref:bifunctional diaminohydroxyphosphoribosylaminopyrimidine deaminase/5-amino-6-(5-phosphoribosylamino)uracil reductase RibD n=1 Tax=Petrocella sp. FN5 TaxID=3032002 RepID=UPI0023D98C06|nr:bifunctional diaminohydroxyphosphoribosylaminopyrimidine deaminase/5-amino-6-(5-phosphoribosylamino)uracil reductase RibD [Petrocella sp. FN5]MDF1617260.1 bifunctional diaminohydroxyphosphoribosylaminopyrimidine deaminase/5-amino-6-(5-phosphoribosylamino)uracil reductase RibD [Petrocella sp. FN5]